VAAANPNLDGGVGGSSAGVFRAEELLSGLLHFEWVT